MERNHILGMDDSEALAHYGVLGMRWGVRNEETRERYARGHLSGDYAERGAVNNPVTQSRRQMSKIATSGRNVQVDSDTAKVVKAKRSMANAGACRDALSISKSDRERYEKSLESGGLTRNQKIALGVGIGVGAAVLIGAGLYANRGLINSWTGGSAGESLAIATKCRQDLQNRIMRDSQLKMAPLDLDKLPDKDTFLPKGQEFHRMARHQFVDAQDSDVNSLFCSYLPHDVKGYRALYPHFAGQQREVAMSPFQDLTMKFTEDIKIPSARKRVELYQEMMRDPTHYESMCRDAVLNRGEGWIKKNGGLDVCTKRLMDRGVEVNASDGQVYRQWAGYAQGARTDSMREYYKRMMKKGYNAITDDNDCGVCSDHPVIIMKNGICKVIGSETIEPKGASYMDAIRDSVVSGQFSRRFSDSPLRHSIFEKADDLKAV